MHSSRAVNGSLASFRSRLGSSFRLTSLHNTQGGIVENLEGWKDRRIVIRHPEPVVSGFVVKIQWVNDPVIDGSIAEELRGIADVYLWDPLPKEWKPKHPRTLLLDVRDGKWYYVHQLGNRVELAVKKIPKF